MSERIEAEQFGFDFEAADRERPIMEHFARLERLQREEWTEENLGKYPLATRNKLANFR
jgi:hypothetical protein